MLGTKLKTENNLQAKPFSSNSIKYFNSLSYLCSHDSFNLFEGTIYKLTQSTGISRIAF